MKTPEYINPNVLLLLKRMSLAGPPYYIPVIEEPYAEMDACFLNVAQKREEVGGEMILGWVIWENEFMIEGEFHGIWQSPDGRQVDITPKLNKEPRILFVVDLLKKYENAQIDNFRLNTSGNNLVDDYIELFRARFRLLNKGARKNVLGEIHLVSNEADMYRAIEAMIDSVQNLLSNGGTRNSICFCGSSIKYKSCHGKDLIQILGKI